MGRRETFSHLLLKFEEGLMVETGNTIPSATYLEKLPHMGDMPTMIKRIEASESPAAIASAIEFVLEGLHLNRWLNRDAVEGRYLYRG